MKRSLVLGAMGIFVLSAVLTLARTARCEVNVNITVPLPGVVIAGPPALVLIPGTYAYFAPDVEVDIIFYQDYWYRPYGGRWYISASYGGPWRSAAVVPRALHSLPPDYRTVQPGHNRMPFGEVKENWRTWERDRHWDKHQTKQNWKEDRGRQKNEKRKGKGKGKGKRRDD